MTRNRLGDKTEIASRGLLVADREKLAKALATALKQGAALKHCHAVEGARAGGLCYEFIAGSPIPVGGRKVFEILQGSLQTYWLGLKVDFVHESKLGDLLTHASMAVFCGLSPDSALPLFRAEWDPRGTSSNHAQPHWNMQDQILRRELSPPARFTPEKFEHTRWQPEGTDSDHKETDAPSSSLKWLSDFHFAMSAKWHEDQGNHSPCPASEDLLKRWVQGCVSYIRDQLVAADTRAAA